MKQRSKRALSWLLTLAMVLGMLPSLAMPAAAADGNGYLTYTGDGTSDGVVYYLTAQQGRGSTNFVEGKQYMFIPGSTAAYITVLPAGAGVLRVAPYDKGARGWSEYNSSNISCWVDVIRATTGFDWCQHGTLNNDATEYNCWAGGAQHVAGGAYNYSEYTFGSKVQVTLMKDNAPWKDARVTLYQNGKQVGSADPDATTGLCDFGYRANGTYAIYVNGEYADALVVNAVVKNENVPKPGGDDFARAHGGFQYVQDGHIYGKTLKYYTLTVNTTLNHDQESADTFSGEPGRITVEDGNRNTILMSGENGTALRVYKDNATPWDVLVGGQDTGHDIGNGYSANATNGTPCRETETVNFYKMKVTLKADRLMDSSEVTLRDESGSLQYILSYDESANNASTNTAAYTLLLQEEETAPGTVSANPTTYYVYVDGQYVNQTVQRVGGDSSTHPYEAEVTFYTAKVTANLDDARWKGAEITLDNGRDHYTMQPDAEGIYTADLLSYVDNGAEIPYTLTVEGVIDPDAATNPTQISSEHTTATLDYYSVTYKTYQKTGGISYELKDAPYRTQYVRKESTTIPPSDAYVDGLSFSWYSDKDWADGDGEYSVKDEFNYNGTAINQPWILYAQFGDPSVKVNEFVRTDASGAISGNGEFFRLENLTISGFDKGDAAIKSAQIRLTNIKNVKFINTQQAVVTEGSVITQGVQQRTLGDGDAATESVVDITFNNGDGLSMAAAQEWLRKNMVFSPETFTEDQVNNTDTDSTCKVEVTVSDGILSSGEMTANTQAATGISARLAGSTTGATLSTGYYYVDSDVSYTNSGAGKSGLTIANGATVYIYVKEGATLTAKGVNGSGRTGGGAGIYVPSNATLYLLGAGAVNATGGNAGNGVSGSSNGRNARVWDGDPDSMRSGSGGNGGNGGGGAGAGIGGSGGTGGTGGAGGANRTERADKGYGHSNGYNGGNGGAGASGTASGVVYIQGELTVTATGGNVGSKGSGGAYHGDMSGHESTNYAASDSGSGWKTSYGAGSGGSGGGGAGGAKAPGIGAGGSGGGGGGGGGGGSNVGRKTKSSPGRGELPDAGRGEGGKAATGTFSGTPGGNGGSYTGSRNGKAGSGEWNSTGGTGGTGGAAGAQASSGAVYKANTATITGTTGNSVACDQTNTVKFIGTTTATYNLGVEKTINVPDYTVPNPKERYFLGWQVSTYGLNMLGETSDLTSAETRLWQPGEQIKLAAATVGNITLIPILREKTGITAKDSYEMTFLRDNMPETTYYTYAIQTDLDGTVTDMGPLVLTAGEKSCSLSPGGSSLIYSMTVSANETFAVTSTKYPRSYRTGNSLGTVTGTAVTDSSTAPQPTVYYFESILVDVAGYDTENLELKPSAGTGPAMSLTGVENGVYRWKNIRQKESADATNDDAYDVYIDGEKVTAYNSGNTAAQAKYAPANKVTVYYESIVVNVSGNAYVDLIELRDTSALTDPSKRIVPEAVDKPVDEGGNKAGVWTWSVTQLRDSASPTYKLYLNGVDTGLTADFKQSEGYTHTLNTPLYLLTVETKTDGTPADVGEVKIGHDTAAVRVDTGKYQLLTTSMLARVVTVAGKNVGAIVPTVSPTFTAHFYTVNYDPEATTTGADDNPVPTKRDNGVYLPDETVTVRSGDGAPAPENSWFKGWKNANDNNTYSVGDAYTIPTPGRTTTFTADWALNSQAEARWIINGETHYGTLAQAIAAANDTVYKDNDGNYISDYTDSNDKKVPTGANVFIYVQNPATLKESVVLPLNTLLTVEEPTTIDGVGRTGGGNLTIDEGVLLANYGTITNDYDMTVKNDGVVLNKYVQKGTTKTGATFNNTSSQDDHGLTLVAATASQAPGRIINEGIFRNSGNFTPNQGFENTEEPQGTSEGEGPGGDLPAASPKTPEDIFGGMADVDGKNEPIIITLNGDVSLKEPIDFKSGKWILDLNGHTLTGPDDKPAIEVSGEAELTVVDTVGGMETNADGNEAPPRRAGKIVGGKGTVTSTTDGGTTAYTANSGQPGLVVGENASVILEAPAAVYGGDGAMGSVQGDAATAIDGGSGGPGVKLDGGTLTVQNGALVQGGNGGDSVDQPESSTGANDSKPAGKGGDAGSGVTGKGTLINYGKDLPSDQSGSPTTEERKDTNNTVQPGYPGSGYTYKPYTIPTDAEGHPTGQPLTSNDKEIDPGKSGDGGKGVDDGDGLDETAKDGWQKLTSGQFSLTPAYKTYTGSELEPDAIYFDLDATTHMKFAGSDNTIQPAYVDDAQRETGKAVPATGEGVVTAPTIGDLTSGKVTITTAATAGTGETVKTYYTTGATDPAVNEGTGAVTGTGWSEYTSGSTEIAIANGTRTTVRAITVKTKTETVDENPVTTVSYSKIAARTFQASVKDLLGDITVKYYKQGTDPETGATTETLVGTDENPGKPTEVGTYTVKVTTKGGIDHDSDIYRRPTDGELTIGAFTIVPPTGNTPVTVGEDETTGNPTITGGTSTANNQTYTVTVNDNSGGRVTGISGAGTYESGASVTLGGTVTDGWTAAWTVDAGGVTLDGNSFTMPEKDVEITVTAKQYADAPIIKSARGITVPERYTEGSISVSAENSSNTGYAALTYQWYDNSGAPIGGATDDTYTLPTGTGALTAATYTYTCAVTATRSDSIDGTPASATVKVPVTVIVTPVSTDDLKAPSITFTSEAKAKITHDNTESSTYTLYWATGTQPAAQSADESTMATAGWTKADSGTYTGDTALTATTTYYAVVVKSTTDGDNTTYEVSPVSSATYTVYGEGQTAQPNSENQLAEPDVAAPVITITPASGGNSATAAITCATVGATIYYTTDGTDLTNTDNRKEENKYTDGTTNISLTQYTHVKAIAVKDDKTSAVTTKTFVPKDVVTIDGGTVTPRKPGKTEIEVEIPAEPSGGGGEKDKIKIEYEVTEEPVGTLKLSIPTYTVPYGYAGLTITGATTASTTDAITVDSSNGKITTKKVTATAVEVKDSSSKALAKIVVEKRKITVTPVDRYLTYGETLPNLNDPNSVTVTGGLATGDSLSTVAIASSDSSASPPAGDYTLTPSDATIATDKTANYEITYKTGELHVEKQLVTVSGIGANQRYFDGTAEAKLRHKTQQGFTSYIDAYVTDGDDKALDVNVSETEGASYTYGNADAGTQRVSLKDDNYLYEAVNYAMGSASQQTAYGIILRRPLSKITDNGETGTTIVGTATAEYNGKLQTPDMLTYAGTTYQLTRGTDYTVVGAGFKNVVYDESTNEPTYYTLSVNGMGNYTGIGEAQFTITPKSISGATITLESGHLIYDGSEQEVVIQSVSVSGVTAPLILGRDYEIVEVTDATNFSAAGEDTARNTGRSSVATAAGKYTLTIKGIGNFAGTASTAFTVGKVPLPEDSKDGDQNWITGVEIRPANTLYYTGYTQDQAFNVTIHTAANESSNLYSSEYTVTKVVKQGTDDEVAGNNVGAPTAKVKEKAAYTATIAFANYDGTKTVDFEVRAGRPNFSITGEKVNDTVKPLAESYQYDAGITQTITLATEYNAVGVTTPPAVTFTSSDPNIATVDSSSGVVTFVKPGKVQITAMAAESGPYARAGDSVTLNITKATSGVTVTSGVTDTEGVYALEKTYGDGTFTIGTATSESIQYACTATDYQWSAEKPITITSSDEDVATVGDADNDGKATVTIRGAGTAVLTILVPETAKYAASSAQITLTVKKATVTAKIDPFTKVYDGGTVTTYEDEGGETHDLEVYFNGEISSAATKGATGVYEDRIAISGVSGTFEGTAGVSTDRTINISQEQAKQAVFSGWPLTDGLGNLTGDYTSVALDDAEKAVAEDGGNWKLSGYLRDYDVLIPKTVTGSAISQRTAYITVYAQDKIYDGTTAATLRTSVTDDDGNTSSAAAIVVENLAPADAGQLTTSLETSDLQVEFARKTASSLAPVNVKIRNGDTFVDIYQTTYDANGKPTAAYTQSALSSDKYTWATGFTGSDNYEVKLRGGTASIDPKVITLTAEGENRNYTKDQTYANFKITSPDGAVTNSFTNVTSGTSATVVLGAADSSTPPVVTMNDTGKALGIIASGTATIYEKSYTISADNQVTGLSAGIDDDSAGRRKVTLSLEGDDADNYELEYPAFYIIVSKVAAAGNLALTIQGWTYGDTPNSPEVKDGTAPLTSGVKYQYLRKTKDNAAEETGAWSYAVPTNAGDYWVKAIVTSENYTETTLYKDFKIEKQTMSNVTDTVYFGANQAAALTYDLSAMVDADAACAVDIGSSNAVVTGTPTVTQQALRYDVKSCRENVTGTVTVNVGASTNRTAFTITLTLIAKDASGEVPGVQPGEVNDNYTVAYTVNYLLQGLNGAYAKDNEHSGTQYAQLGETVTPVVWKFTGFETPAAQSARITKAGQSFTFRYLRQRYELESDLVGGTTEKPLPDSVLFGTPVEDLPEPKRDGYDFDGWEIKYDDPDDPEHSPKTITTDKDGKVVKTVDKDNHEIASPAAQKPGDPATIPAADGPVTITAKWKEKDNSGETWYTVTYDANNGTGTTPAQRVLANGAVTVAKSSFSRDDHRFAAWNTKADGTGEAYAPGASLSVTANVTLYAQWDGKYTVKHLLQDLNNGGTGAANTYTTPIGEDAYVYAKDDDAAKALTGALTAEGYEVTSGQPTVTTHVITYQYDRKQFTLTKNPNAGTETEETESLYYGQPLPDRTRTGYTFLGWFDKPTGGTRIETMPAQDTRVYAHWATGTRVGAAAVVNAAVSSGESGIKNVVSSRSDDNNATALVKAMKEDMQKEADAQENAVESNQTLKLTMTLDVYGDVGAKNYTEEQQVLVDALTSYMERAGADEETLTRDFFDVVIEKELGLTSGAQTTTSTVDETVNVVEITLDYEMAGKTWPAVFRCHDGTAQQFVRLTSEPTTPRDATFWAEEVGDNGISTFHIYSQKFSDFLIGAAEPRTDDVYYTVTFNGAGGTLKEALTYVKGGDTLPNEYFGSGGKTPARSGYTFAGWKNDAADWTASTPVTGDVTLTAQWKVASSGGSTGGGGGGGGDLPTSGYPPIIPQTPHGSVDVNPQEPYSGDPVTIMPKPDDGYRPDEIIVTGPRGEIIPVTDNGDGTYSFIQPDGPVTIRVRFVHGNYVDCPRDESCPISAFSDASPTAWYHDGVHYVLENDVMVGYDTGKFGPNDTTTRAMMAQILYNMEGKPVIRSGIPFDDVAETAWYAKAVSWAEANGVMAGYGDGQFGPNDGMTREQLVTIVYNYAKYKGVDVSATSDFAGYTDVEQVSAWALNAMRWAVGSGTVLGRTNTTLNPKDTATRAEIATIMMKYCTEIAE